MHTRPTIDSLTAQATAMGVAIEYVRLPPGRRGQYCHATRTIQLAAGLSDDAAVPVLLHEIEHARRGDDGPQPPHVEHHIDVGVARALIQADAYARAEALTGGHPALIARELRVPARVVTDYQEWLRRTR